MAGVAIYTKIEGNRYHHAMVAVVDGATCPTHEHAYDHTSYCREGRAKAWSANGGCVVLKKGDSLLVPKGVAHDFEFETAGTTIECVHTLRFEDGTEVPFDYKLTRREGARLTGLL